MLFNCCTMLYVDVLNNLLEPNRCGFLVCVEVNPTGKGLKVIMNDSPSEEHVSCVSIFLAYYLCIIWNKVWSILSLQHSNLCNKSAITIVSALACLLLLRKLWKSRKKVLMKARHERINERGAYIIQSWGSDEGKQSIIDCSYRLMRNWEIFFTNLYALHVLSVTPSPFWCKSHTQSIYWDRFYLMDKRFLNILLK